MNKVIDVNVEEFKQSAEKITINLKNINPDHYSVIKCFKNYEEINTLEAKKINLLKIQKTIFLNLSNLHTLDLRENKLLKISKNFVLLKNLKILRLDDNLISFLPSFISNFEKLDTLTISNNKITYLPTSLQYMQKLKSFKFSRNQIGTIPIEIGLLKSLECLHMDANHFTEIPTTLCYLKHLSELSFEWLEFLDPPFQKLNKDNLGKTVITLIRTSLQEMIKQNILYCDYFTFMDKNSNPKPDSNNNRVNTTYENEYSEEGKCKYESITNEDISERCLIGAEKEIPANNYSNKNFSKIFYAIENNYLGVIKCLISNNDEYLKIKNNDNKTPLYLAIHSGKVEITNQMLYRLDFSKIGNSHIYLHKAIRMRDPLLTEKLLDLGVDINSSDDQGSTCFHVLFSSFTKSFSKCSLIGDILLKRNSKLNSFNNENWAPIHIAARRASKECIVWIIKQNKILRSMGRETFDINLKVN